MVAAIVLAAGAATRFGAPKQRLLLPEVLARIRGVDEVVVVSGAYELEGAVACPDWDARAGSLAPLRTGETRAGGGGRPRRARGRARPRPGRRRARARRVARERGAARRGELRRRPRPSALVARSLWDAIPDEGLREREPLLVPCDDLGAPGDVDEPDDLPERLKG